MKIKQFFAGSLLLLLFDITGYAQSTGPTNTLDWVVPLASLSLAKEIDAKVDQSGNVYSVGIHQATMDCDPGPGIYTVPHHSDYDIHFTKFDNNGNLIWARAIGGPGRDEASAIEVDAAGNVYVIGTFKETVDFELSLSSSTSIMSAVGTYSTALFIAKYDAMGSLAWAKKFDHYHSYVSESLKIDDIEIDDNNNIHLVGAFYDTLNVVPQPAGSGSPSSVLLIGRGETDGFAVVLDTDGNYIRSRQFGGVRSDRIRSVCVDSDLNVYYTGEFREFIDVSSDSTIVLVDNPSPGGSSSDQTAIVISDDSNGNLRWAKRYVGDTHSNGMAIDCDPDDNIVVVGEFMGTTDFDPNVGIQTFYAKKRSTFITKLDFNGNLIWAEYITQITTLLDAIVVPTDVTTDINSNVYLFGYFDGIVDFDPDPSVLEGASGQNFSYDSYILKFNQHGDFNMMRQISGDLWETQGKLAVDECENIYAAGLFMGTANFATNAAVPVTLTSPNTDGYLLKIKKQARGCGNLNNPIGNSANNDRVIQNQALISPNPSPGKFHVSVEETLISEVVVIDATGRHVLSQEVNGREADIDLSQYQPGVYSLVVKRLDGTATQRVMITN
ncbi:MAG: T9SS type A sorting domain-containing protein [Fluviicola sp.]